MEAVVALVITLALLLGSIPGAWCGARGYDQRKGHAWLAAIVLIVAVAGLGLYTFTGPSEELFTRLVILPFTVVVALVASAVLIGAPLFVGYVLAYRVARSIAGKASGGNGDS